MTIARVALAVVVGLAVAACAPSIDGPADHQRAVDREDGDRLAAQLAQLPGAVHAEVTLHRPLADPLAAAATAGPPSAALLVVVDDQADRRTVTDAALALTRGAAPEVASPAIVVEVGAVRPTLARVGPFTVEARSKPALVAALAIAFALIAALAGLVAWRERWRVRAG